jgi:N utilization substance protein B
MNRRQAREYVLQALFERDFTGTLSPAAYSAHSRDREPEETDDTAFAEELIKGTLEHLNEIDTVIQKFAEHWTIERMPVVDRNILRFSIYEILYRKDIPSAVTINEALEIAKKYSSSESVAFINGLLDKISRRDGAV